MWGLDGSTWVNEGETGNFFLGGGWGGEGGGGGGGGWGWDWLVVRR